MSAPAPWDSFAAQWHHLGPPLRLSPEDVALYRQAVGDPGHPLRLLLLGVTPELAEADWPTGSTVQAVDRSAEMLRAVWPGDLPGVREAREGQWLTLTPEEGRFDGILCDAGLNLLSFPTEQGALLTRLASLLTPSGRIVLRLFTAPEQAESPEALHAAARRGEIDSFHAYKLRLAVALQAEADAGVPVAEVRRVVLARWGTLQALADAAGWSLDAVRTLELYRDKPSRMWFPTRRAWCDALPHTLTLQAVHEPGYPLGPRCPVLVLARKR